MLGAIIGDIVGSRFEFRNHRSKDFKLFDLGCSITDDSIMTLAVAKAILACQNGRSKLNEETIRAMQTLGYAYPDAGYGGMFFRWLGSKNPQPYNSFGNGAAMRVSPCAWAAKTEAEAKELSKLVTEVTHNHPEGIKGAEATTVAIFMARSCADKEAIRARIEKEYYDLNFTIDEIRPTYKFNETCQETVPQAIAAFLESESFEDCIRTAISVGGDSDTLAAIAGSIAEAFYGVPDTIREKALTYLPADLKDIFDEWETKIQGRKVSDHSE